VLVEFSFRYRGAGNDERYAGLEAHRTYEDCRRCRTSRRGWREGPAMLPRKPSLCLLRQEATVPAYTRKIAKKAMLASRQLVRMTGRCCTGHATGSGHLTMRRRECYGDTQ
jgi:hypothetical protein